MRFSTAFGLVTISSLVLLITPAFHSNGVVSAALTAEERIEVEAKDPGNPNYCPACLKKAMINHFPHACPKDLEPMEATTRPEGPRPHEQRCVCISFMDLYWMKLDCTQECTFVHDVEAMSHFVPASSIPGCDKWVDFETGKEKEVEGFEKKDPSHKPEVFTQDSTDNKDVKEDNKQSEVEEPKAEEPNVKVEADVKTDEVKSKESEAQASKGEKLKETKDEL
ncbi:hypothetical protein BGX28_002427 [Mortierella sp. GBA30]|nr:hypothetical protein BGX28_002427 [Mortierella sp. GBA30]